MSTSKAWPAPVGERNPDHGQQVAQLKTHLGPATREFIEQVSEQRDPALDEGRGKFGVLFSRRLAEMLIHGQVEIHPKAGT